jgi:hypothetical protein
MRLLTANIIVMLTLGLFINANGQTNVTTGNHRAIF